MKRFWFYFFRLRHQPRLQKSHPLGLSLVELMVSMVLAVIAISVLLGLMVEGMTYNQREQALNKVNEEMKQALDYIAKDLREAVYVYNGEQLEDRGIIDGLKEFLPDFGDDTRPILAFWKVDPYTPSELDDLPANCETTFASDSVKKDACIAAKIERRAYTLVVYLQSTANPDGKWKGESRIERYQLRKYSDMNTLTRTPGYVDPVSESENFKNWPIDKGKNLQVETPPDQRDTLVDFVAAPTAEPDINIDILENELGCEIITNSDTEPNKYISSPLNTATGNDDAFSFFACVRKQPGVVSNQDVILFLRGDAKGRPGITKNAFVPYLKTQVLSRGVLNKSVSD